MIFFSFTLVQGDAGELPFGGESRDAGCENVVWKRDFTICPIVHRQMCGKNVEQRLAQKAVS